MDTKNNYTPVVDEEVKKAAELFCSATKEDQALVVAFKSGIDVGMTLANASGRKGR